MATKFICDMCKVNDCSNMFAETRMRTKVKNSSNDMLLALRTETRHVCDECWTTHVRLFAEKVLSDDPPEIMRWDYA